MMRDKFIGAIQWVGTYDHLPLKPLLLSMVIVDGVTDVDKVTDGDWLNDDGGIVEDELTSIEVVARTIPGVEDTSINFVEEKK